VALGAVILFTVIGTLPRIVSTVGGAFSGITGAVVPASPSPSPSPAAVPDAPVLDVPAQATSNQPTVTITGSVPASIGSRRTGYTIRLYVTLPKAQPILVSEIPLGETLDFTIPDVTLKPGRNDFTATIHGPGGESAPSAVVTYGLDTTPPKITLSAPTDKSTVNADSVTITGKTQARSAITARDGANGRTVLGTADTTGAFQVIMPLVDGTNAISVTATDPAGNSSTSTVTVLRGTGTLKVVLTASSYRISAAKLPRTLVLSAVATDPAGNGLPGRDITFTLSIPGVPLITGQSTTDTTGLATFQTTVPAGATTGTGPGTAFLTTPEYGDASGGVVITITP
jgi:hypothetical protein